MNKLSIIEAQGEMTRAKWAHDEKIAKAKEDRLLKMEREIAELKEMIKRLEATQSK